MDKYTFKLEQFVKTQKLLIKDVIFKLVKTDEITKQIIVGLLSTILQLKNKIYTNQVCELIIFYRNIFYKIFCEIAFETKEQKKMIKEIYLLLNNIKRVLMLNNNIDGNTQHVICDTINTKNSKTPEINNNELLQLLQLLKLLKIVLCNLKYNLINDVINYNKCLDIFYEHYNYLLQKNNNLFNQNKNVITQIKINNINISVMILSLIKIENDKNRILITLDNSKHQIQYITKIIDKKYDIDYFNINIENKENIDVILSIIETNIKIIEQKLK